jgi:hypothetical protein
MNYGRWTIIGEVDKERKVLCQCECGTVREVCIDSLTRGLSLSCGCRKRELMKTNNPIRHRWDVSPEVPIPCPNAGPSRVSRKTGRTPA